MVPRGSARFVEQVAQWLVEHGAIPRDAFERIGIEAPSARLAVDQIFDAPEETSIRAGWPRGYGRR
jgi:hypothetical protein